MRRMRTEDGHAGIDVRGTSNCTEIIICATRTHDVLDEKGRRTREPVSIVQRRFECPWNSVGYFTKSSRNRARCAAQTETSRQNFSVISLFIDLYTVSCDPWRMMARRTARCRSMKSEDGSLTSSGKPKWTTLHSRQLKARIELTLSRNVRTVRSLSGDACARARRIVVSSIPNGQRAVLQVQQRQASYCDEFMTPGAEDAVCTPSTLMFHLTVFLFRLQSAVDP